MVCGLAPSWFNNRSVKNCWTRLWRLDAVTARLPRTAGPGAWWPVAEAPELLPDTSTCGRYRHGRGMPRASGVPGQHPGRRDITRLTYELRSNDENPAASARGRHVGFRSAGVAPQRRTMWRMCGGQHHRAAGFRVRQAGTRCYGAANRERHAVWHNRRAPDVWISW